MSNLTGPNFYKIDFEREIVLQGKSTTFLTINRNDDVLADVESLYVIFYPNSRTFNSIGSFDISQTLGTASGQYVSEGFINQDFSIVDTLRFNNLAPGLYVKNTQDFMPLNEGPVQVEDINVINTGSGSITKVKLASPTGTSEPFVGATGSTATKKIVVGYYSDVDKSNWKINTVDVSEIESQAFSAPSQGAAADWTTLPNPFDGSTYSPTGGSAGGFTGTGAVTRPVAGFSSSIIATSSPGLTGNRGITLRIDYEGNNDSHLKLNMLIVRYDPTNLSFGALTPTMPFVIPESIAGFNNPNSYSSSPFGFKSGYTGTYSDNVDYQEVHLFGYQETTVRTSRTTYQNDEIISNPVYDDRSSYGLLKTNPKLSGNVKLTVDSTGEMSLNSFDANAELSDSKYKRYPVSPESQYQRDLYTFFKGTPNEVIFQLYQVDDQYQNTKRELYQQYDNFYNYGVEQLASKFYDEDFSFLAPLWMRKVLPEFFVIFRVDHPASIVSYEGGSTQELFTEIFKGARIIKTYDMRATSKLGRYLRKIVDDPRFKERPLEVSYDQDTPTTWNGISIKDATITGKGEFLYDFWRTDRPIKELETFITSGFERNGLVSANLINLEFLFDDPEATEYSINRYFGFYVSEIQLAELEIASSVLGKIPGQSPEPKPGVDGEPYSTRPFIQTNPNGIELPVEYYHNTKYANNTSIVPYYQGNVVGKLPLPAMVDDPLRIFYVKDRVDSFKRVIGLSEVDYGYPGTNDYRRVTQLKLFDTEEDISTYGGPTQIISQLPTTLLKEGDAQLIVHLINQGSGNVIADEEVLELSVKNYNTSDKEFEYHFQVVSASGSDTTFVYFQDQKVTSLFSSFVQPTVGGTASVSLDSTDDLGVNETVYIVNGGYYSVVSIISGTSAILKNLGTAENVAPATSVPANSLVGSFPTGFSTYSYTALNYLLSVDNNITLDLSFGYSGSSTLYSALDSFKVSVAYPEVIQTVTNGSNGFNAIISRSYVQYRWRMTAKADGLKKGKAWPFPVEDPNGYDYISNFNNEGTPEQVAQAIAACVNSFENSPAQAIAVDNKIILKSKLKTYDGNTIQFRRIMSPRNSYIKNLGFYEDGNVNKVRTISKVDYPGYTSSENLKVEYLEENDLFGDFYYYVRVNKGISGINNIIVRSDVDPSSWTYVTTTGTYNCFFTTENVFDDPSLPFVLDITDISTGAYQDFVVKVSLASDASQLFVGGAGRRRSRAKIAYLDGERYFQDRKIKVASTVTAGATAISVSSTEGIYVGAPIVGTGVSVGSKVLTVEPAGNYVTISGTASATGTYDFTYGNLSILNDEKFLQQWFQTAKSQFSRLLPWDVQGKWIYSLPYLEEPTYDAKNRVTGYTDINSYSIIEIENQSQEFYLSDEKRIVAYNMYRPTIGMFSMFPIKEFDFDFFFSDYSYSPVLETYRYFFNETVESGQSIELSPDGNYLIVPQVVDPTDPTGTKKISATGTFGFSLEGFNTSTNTWDTLSTVSSVTTTSTDGLIINTYTPFYRYDVNEHPQKYDDPAYYIIRGMGLRNYERALVSKSNNDKSLTVTDVKRFRLTYDGSVSLPYLNIKKSDFSADKDITNFSGFAALQNILNLNDQQQISFLRNQGLFVESYLYQQLKSEYDRLRENFTKEFATFSRVVPFVNKWVQEGTDARDNYYRLNNSLAFGISNLSPDDSVDFAEPLILSHEFPYLDTVPKDYPEESVAGSRSYMFAKLSDIAYEGKSWYELLTTDNTKDWFLKYFSVGYPTEINYNGELINKPREERFTFFTYNEGIKRVQTLFRGVKIQIIDIDADQPELPEVESSTKYNQYKFAAIQRIIPYSFYKKESPLDIEVIKNDKFKSVTIIITKRTQDYRLQSGLQDYLFNYASGDNLKNYNQQQYKISSFVSNDSSMFYPYDATVPANYTDQSVMRPRQLYMGGGYLQIGDPKLSGAIDTDDNDPTYNISAKYLSAFLKSSNSNYPFIVSDEVNPFENSYPIGSSSSTYPFVYDFNSMEVIPFGFGTEGFLNKFISTGTAIGLLYLYDFTDNRNSGDTILPDSVGFSSPQRYPYYRHNVNTVSLNNGLGTFSSPNGTYFFETTETFNLQGGNQFYSSTKNLYSFANIKKNINENSSLIKYYKVDETGITETQDFRLFIVSADQIVKSGVLNTKIDEDRPPQYKNAPIIGYDIVNTNQNELVIRHRGYYEPKATDVITFWVREDQELTRHFSEDFLLSNTHINNKTPLSGVLNNYGINKVALSEILKISQGTAYRSVYQFIKEIAIDSKDVQVLNSTWDASYYRRYTDLDIYADVDGINEMQEFKAFLGSKAMTVPKALDIQTFLPTEVKFNVIAPSISEGVSVETNAGTTKPVLVIDLSLEERLIRELIAGINSTTSVDEFAWAIDNLGLSEEITEAQVAVLKEQYIRKNIVPLYEISGIFLYSLQKDGIPILIIDLTEAEKTSAGYRIDKDCVVRQLSKFNFTINKTLDTKKSYGYSIGVTIKRI